MRKKRRPLQPINPLLDNMFRDLGISERIKLDNLKRRWPDIFSGPLALHTLPVDIKDGMLTIAVDSPTWLQHLKFMKKEMIEKLAPFEVKDVKFRHGGVEFRNEIKVYEQKAQPEDFRELTAEDKRRIQQTVDEIDDPDLKESIRKAMEKSARRKMG
jgi:hypothetical protein